MYQQKAECRGARGSKEGRCESCVKDHALHTRNEESSHPIETKGYQEVSIEGEEEEGTINDCKEDCEEDRKEDREEDQVNYCEHD